VIRSRREGKKEGSLPGITQSPILSPEWPQGGEVDHVSGYRWSGESDIHSGVRGVGTPYVSIKTRCHRWTQRIVTFGNPCYGQARLRPPRHEHREGLAGVHTRASQQRGKKNEFGRQIQGESDGLTRDVSLNEISRKKSRPAGRKRDWKHLV